jgi:RNA polymerase-binding transcription factor DksA
VFAVELICGNCSWRTVCGREEAVARLRSNGMLRRDPDPDDELVRVLMVDSVSRMRCSNCDEKRLTAHTLDSDELPEEVEWQTAVLCEVCREPISPERLEALPTTKRCVRCQGNAEVTSSATETTEYCPHCGAPIQIRVSRGAGITRYKRFCTGNPPCRL